MVRKFIWRYVEDYWPLVAVDPDKEIRNDRLRKKKTKDVEACRGFFQMRMNTNERARSFSIACWTSSHPYEIDGGIVLEKLLHGEHTCLKGFKGPVIAGVGVSPVLRTMAVNNFAHPRGDSGM